jgi:hypothetical protein
MPRSAPNAGAPQSATRNPPPSNATKTARTGPTSQACRQVSRVESVECSQDTKRCHSHRSNGTTAVLRHQNQAHHLKSGAPHTPIPSGDNGPTSQPSHGGPAHMTPHRLSPVTTHRSQAELECAELHQPETRASSTPYTTTPQDYQHSTAHHNPSTGGQFEARPSIPASHEPKRPAARALKTARTATRER